MNNIPSDMDAPDFNSLAQRALKQIRALAHGNGANTDAVQIKHIEGEVIHCEAITHLELHPDITEEQKKGKQNIGEPLKDPAQLQQTVQAHTVSSIKNDEVRRAMASMLLDRDDKGFSLHAEYFDMPPLKKTYSAPQDCDVCKGHGRTGCERCGGRRQETCNKCQGRSMIACNFCHGSGFTQGPDGNQRQCTHCHGQRQIACVLCHRTGVITCRHCKGTGDVKCNTCKGLGGFTQITHVNLQMKTLFEIDRAALPHPVVKAIEDQGDKLVARKHITVHGEQVKREDGGLAIQYHTQFPYADLEISVNGKSIKTHIFGARGKIIKLPPFLEHLIDVPFTLLQNTIEGSGNAQANITKASKTRILGQALLFCLMMPQKKAFIALKKKYPMGISNEALKDIIQTSKKSLDKLTATARYSGYIIAGIFNTVMNGAYFAAGARDHLISILGQNGTIIADLALIPLGGFIGSFITKYIAKRPIKKTLGHLTQNPRLRKLGVLPNYGLSLGIFIAIILTLKILGYALPSWLPF